MEFHSIERVWRINFILDLNASDVADEVTFIVLVSGKFDGEVSRIALVSADDEERRALVGLQFKNYESWDGVRGHCSGHLDKAGHVNASYRGALAYADPGLRATTALLARLRAAK